MIPQNQYYSFNLGKLPEGCQYCVKGEKLVLFATGLCPRRCYFCPVSDAKFNHDVSFANERLLQESNNLFEECEAMDAQGAGITGGDPLVKIERTVKYIKELKQRYGKQFHIHLYTSLNLVTKEKLKMLFDADLDEIRFHLDLDSKQLWNYLTLARDFSWKIGVELPLVPTKKKEIMQVIEFIHNKVDFVVLNELECADNNQSKLHEMGFVTKDFSSYAIQNSLLMGKEILQEIKEKYNFSTHLCTAKLKDAVQLTNRLKREGEHNKKIFDVVTKEGLLIRGAIYLPELAPGFSYREKLKNASKSEITPQLERIYYTIKEKLHLKEQEIYLDQNKLRLLLSTKNLKKNILVIKQQNVLCAIVKEYPTADQLEIEVEFLE